MNSQQVLSQYKWFYTLLVLVAIFIVGLRIYWESFEFKDIVWFAALIGLVVIGLKYPLSETVFNLLSFSFLVLSVVLYAVDKITSCNLKIGEPMNCHTSWYITEPTKSILIGLFIGLMLRYAITNYS